MSSVERGWYSSRVEPLLHLSLFGLEGRRIEIEVLVDTGFNRSLLVFAPQAREAHLAPTMRVASRLYLADGSVCRARSTFGYVKWLGQMTEIEILVVAAEAGPGDRCLLGMELLRGTDILLGRREFEIGTHA